MILKALLAWAGLRAAPCFHDPRVHDAMNDDAAIISGVRIMARQSRAVAGVMLADPEDAARINKGIVEMRSTLAEVARRADR